MIHFEALRLGYGPLLRELEQSIQLMRLPHGLLFSGPPGVGKRTVSEAVAHFVLGQFRSFTDMQKELTPSHPLVRHISQRSHPEWMVLSPRAPIEQIRSAIYRLGQTSFTDSWRVVLVPQCDKLSLNSVNALLKVIESPPSRTLFLLTASGPVLKTLVSRCMVYAMHPLSDPLFNRTLTTMNIVMPQDPLFYWISQGCVGRALTLLEHFSWARQSWNLLTQAAQGPCLLPQEWLDTSLSSFSLWQEIFFLWVHKMALPMYSHTYFFHFLEFVQSTRTLVKEHEIYHTDPTLILYTVHAKITEFFLKGQVPLPDPLHRING